MITPNGIFEEYQQKLVTNGRWDSDIWFITMQGCCDTNQEEEAQIQFDNWNNVGRPVNYDFHDAIPNHCFFNDFPYCRQPTWSGLIKLLFGYYKITNNKNNYYDFQSNHWGRNEPTKYAQNIFGLLPLGKSNLGQFRDFSDTWHKWTDLDYMRDTETYERRWLTYRIEKLKQKIIEIKPKVVIFHTKTHTDTWNEIAGCNFSEFENTNNSITECPKDFSAEFYQNNGTLYINMASPVAFGTCNNYFRAIGEKIFDFVGHRNLGKV